MAGEFGDLIGFDFGGGFGGDAGIGNLDVPTTMPTPAPDTGGFSFSDLASGVGQAGKAVGAGIQGALQPVADIAKPLLPIAGLATAGMGIAGGIQNARTAAQQTAIARKNQQLQQQAAANTAAAARPLTQFGEQQLQLAQQGQIPPQIQAKIDQWKAGALAMAKDRLARQGLGDSQAMDEWVKYIEQQARAMAATYLQEEQALGLQGLTQGAQTLASAGGQAGNVVSGAQQQQGSIDQLMRATNDALARLGAAA